jgi:asparagine synthase (glutamine-hydrolysing)
VDAIFGFTGPPDRDLYRCMAKTLAHRGAPFSFDESNDGTLGYLRLHDYSELECRGGLIRDGDVVLAIAGQPRSDSPSRVSIESLLRDYQRDGLETLTNLSGAFVLAVRDGNALHLIRDAAGLRTLYYSQHAGRLIFAVEPKGVVAAPGFPRRIRPAAVAQFFTFSFVPGRPTMLEGINEIPAGHQLSYLPERGNGPAEPCVKRYFFFEDVPKEEGPPAIWADRFREAFSRAVTEQLPDDDRVGLFLSGGIDSSIVAAELVRHRGPGLKTYAIHFGNRYPHELDFARQVAASLRTDHREVLIRPQHFLPRLRKMIWHLDEPIGDPITMPNFELAGSVANEVRWVFNGEGGDPLFGGPKNLPMLLHHWYGGVPRDPNFRARRYLASYRRAYEELDHLLLPEWRNQYDPDQDLEGILNPFFEQSPPVYFLDKLTAINIRLKGAHLILPKVERMIGAWGLTPLSPLFDRQLIELSFRMPTKMKLCRGMEKVVLKAAYRGVLPDAIIDRPKSGMRVPVHYWFRNELKRYARRLLSPRTIRQVGMFDPKRVKQLLDYDTQEGRGRYGLRLWMLLTFEIWRRIVVEGEPV